MNFLSRIYYKLVSPKHPKDAIERYRDEFSSVQIVSNFKTLFNIMVGLELVELSLIFTPTIIPMMRLAAIIFVFTNGLLLIATFIFRQRDYQYSFKNMFIIQHLIVFNIIALVLGLNLSAINQFDFIHVYIVGFMFISITLYIPVVSLTLLALISASIQIIGLLIYQQDPVVLQHQVINVIVFIMIAWYLGILSNQKTTELWFNHKKQLEVNQMLEDSNKRDSMTRFYNHESILFQLNQLVNQAKINNSTFSILMLDIDNFKNVNDTFGHQEGDKVILEVAKAISHAVRDLDLIGRYGGEEFLIIFPETIDEKACSVSERIRKAVESLKFDKITMSISGGLVNYDNQSADEMLELADNRLYIAKRTGKNRIICQDESSI